jgi:hypothetical protein
MVKLNRFFLTYALVTTVIIIIMSRFIGCGGPASPYGWGGYTKTVTVQQTLDTVKAHISIPTFKPKVVYVKVPDESQVDSFPYVDSNYCKQLVAEFITQRTYLDTVKTKHGDSLQLVLKSFVSSNKLDSVKADIDIKIPFVKTETTTIIEPIPKTPWKFYICGNIGTNGLGFVGGPEMALTDRNHFIYKAGVDFSTFSTPVYRIGFGYKISFPKKKKVPD